MTNLRTGEMVFIRNLTKIGTNENKAIYSKLYTNNAHKWSCLTNFILMELPGMAPNNWNYLKHITQLLLHPCMDLKVKIKFCTNALSLNL